MGGRCGVGGPSDLAPGSAPHAAEAPSERARAPAPAWYDVTWNPTGGCSPAGPGCDHCPALRTVAQLARMGGKAGARYAGLTVSGHAGLQWTGEIRVRADVLTWPLIQRRRRRILVNSLSDLFHEQLETGVIDTLHAVMAIAHWHRFLVLTRRAERMRTYYADPQTPQRIAAEIDHMAATVLPTLGSSPRPPARAATGDAPAAARAGGAGMPQQWLAGLSRVIRGTADPSPVGLDPWPLPNLWLGVSVEDQQRITRIGDLLQIPAVLRWVSFEPLLGPVRPDAVPVGDEYVDALDGRHYRADEHGHMVPIDGEGWRPLDWAVAGGETGAGARPTDPDWVRTLRDRCRAAGVPFFFKQWGNWAPAAEDGCGRRMVRLGQRAAGRLVDGRSWDEMPAAMRQWRDRSR